MRNQKRIAMSIGLLLGMAVWWQAPTVFAETGDYPYADKPCIWAPYATQGTAANWCPDYDFGDAPNNESAANVISSYGYYYRNCTDYTAWKVSTAGISPDFYKGLGNAKDWAVRAAAKAIRVDAIPAAGAVGVRTTGTYGHTAYIEAVHEDGSVTLSHYNYRGDGNYSRQTGLPAAFGLTLFIHFEDYVAPVAPEVLPESVPVVAAPDTPPPPEITPVLSTAAEVSPQEPASPMPQAVPEEVEAPPVVTLAATETPVPAAEQQIPPDTSPPPPALPAAPVRAVWQQAATSPPSVTLAAAEPLGATVYARPQSDSSGSYWPLLGLVGALLAQGPITLRQRLTQAPPLA